jgi:hypothetical protein
MKKLLVGLLVLGSISSFAGELISRKSLERIEFNLDSTTNTLSVVSYTPLVESKDILLKNLKKNRSSIKLFAAISGIKDPQGYYSTWETDSLEGQWGPGAYPFAAIYDIALLPFKAPIKVLKNKQLKKDYTKLLQAINSNNEVKVSLKRFERIAGLLESN